MGTIKQGINGPFSGGVGEAVGSSWNGISYIRSYAAKISNPRTDPQQDHRQKIAVTMKFLKTLKVFLRIGFKNYADKMTEINAAMSWNYHNALQGSYPNNAIDYAKALLTHGLLPAALNPKVSFIAGAIRFTWDDNSGEAGASGLDKTLLVVYNPLKQQALTANELATRAEKSQTINVPDSFTGDLVHCYIGFITAEGADLSDSQYAGAVIIT